MKYPTKPINISQILPSAVDPKQPFVVTWLELDDDGRIVKEAKRRFYDPRLARRFRRKLIKIRNNNREVRYATA